MNKVNIYLIECLTNLHAGSGDESYGIIDNRVQRDPASGYPTIYSSSLKGALREFFEKDDKAVQTVIEKLGTEQKQRDFVTHVFGSKPDERNNVKQGAFIFMGAQLLSMPVRSNVRAYFNTTTTELLDEYINFNKLVGADPAINANAIAALSVGSPTIIGSGYNNPLLEDTRVEQKTLSEPDLKSVKNLLGANPAVLPLANARLVKDTLPVIARNQLDNGESKNLWYEEVVPRFSRFYFAIGAPGLGDAAAYMLDTFDSVLCENIIQIGANATVGYGYCKISKL